MSAFDLSSEEDYEARASKVMSLYDVYCQDRVHDLEEWNSFKVKVNFPKRIDCTRIELLSQFKKAFEKMNFRSSFLSFLSSLSFLVIQQES